MEFVEKRTGQAPISRFDLKRRTDKRPNMGGRPRKAAGEGVDRRMSLRFSDEQQNRLKVLASQSTLSEAALIRLALEHFLDNFEEVLRPPKK